MLMHLFDFQVSKMTASVIELEEKLKKKIKELQMLQEGEAAMQEQLRVRCCVYRITAMRFTPRMWPVKPHTFIS